MPSWLTKEQFSFNLCETEELKGNMHYKETDIDKYYTENYSVCAWSALVFASVFNFPYVTCNFIHTYVEMK
jgi:hypothetical protein